MSTTTTVPQDEDQTQDEDESQSGEKLADHCGDELKRLICKFENLDDWKSEFQIGSANRAIGESHQGRSLFEFLQNGRDAIRDGNDDGHLAVIVDEDSTWIANTGAPFDLHDGEVEEQVRLIGSSEKPDDAIGEKGIGLRSVLMCAEKFEVHSRVGDDESVHAVYSRAPTTRALLEAYLRLNPAYDDLPAWLKGEKSLDRFELADDFDIDLDIDDDFEEHEFFDRLPLVNLFTAAPMDDGPDEVSEALLNGENLSEQIPDLPNPPGPFGSDLEGFTTVIRLEHRDDDWREFLRDISDHQEFETGSDFQNHIEEATLYEFDEEPTVAPEPVLADECDEIDPETLVLFDNVDSARFWWRRDNDDWEYRFFDIEKRADGGDLENIERECVEVEINDSERSPSRLYRLYTTPFADEDENDRPGTLKCLVPNPNDESEHSLSPKPLHLFYPIEDVPTPFRFVLHGPFAVSADRQELLDSESDANEEILEGLRDLVGRVAEDLAVPDSSDFASYMPWLVMPDDTELDGSSDQYCNEMRKFYERLEELDIVPVDDSEPRPPSEILFDPKRPHAFEVLRNGADFDKVDFDLADESSIGATEELGTHVPSRNQCLGMTEVLDTPIDDGTGWVERLGDIWPEYSDDAPDNDIGMAYKCEEDRENPDAYYDAIATTIGNAADLDADQTRDIAANLGKQKTPLIPAHIDDEAYLVRVVNREEAGQNQPAERIVFRTEDSAHEAPKPKTDLSVYFTARDGSEWFSDAQVAESFGRIWGMTSYGGTSYYRRIASEFGKRPEKRNEKDTEGLSEGELSFLRKAYWHAISAADNPADWLEPTPLRVEAADDIDEKLTGSWGSKPDNNFRRRKWIPNIHLPADSEESKPARAICFGPEWTDRFHSLAETLENNQKSSEVIHNLGKYSSLSVEESEAEESDDDEENLRKEIAAKLRRWKKLIETTEELNGLTDYETRLAGPEEFGLTPDVENPDQALEIIFHLIHLGVGIGPQVRIWWFAPECDHPGSLSDSKARNLSVCAEPELLQKCVPGGSRNFLKNYQDLVWSSEYHPTITAKHSGGCSLHREETIDLIADLDSNKASNWLQSERFRRPNRDVAVAEWIDIPLLEEYQGFDSPNSDTARQLRRLIRLAWPEWKGRITDTAWLCGSNNHHIRKKQASVPTTAWFLVHQLPVWEHQTGAECDDDSSEPMAASHLVAPQDENAQLRGAKQYLPRVVDSDTADGIDPSDYPELPSFRRFARDIGTSEIDDLTPLEAAAQLQWFVDANFEENDEKSDKDEEIRTPWYALLRRLVSTDHLTEDFEDSIARMWVARDLGALNWPLLVRDGTVVRRLAVDEQTELYKKRLDRQKREYRDENRALVFRPADVAPDLFDTLDFLADDNFVEFDGRTIHLSDSDPEPPRFSLEGGQSNEEDKLEDELKDMVRDRTKYLVAACHKTRRNVGAEVLEDVHKQLAEWLNNGRILTVDKSPASGVASALGKGDDDTIVVRQKALDDLPPAIARCSVLAEGIVQYLDQKLSNVSTSEQLVEKFEEVLGTEPKVLKHRWQDTVEQLSGQLAQYAFEKIEAIWNRLESLFESLVGTADLPGPEEDQHEKHQELLSQIPNLTNGDNDDLNPHLSEWLEILKGALEQEDCLEENEAETVARQIVEFARLQHSSSFSSTPETCDILRRLNRERDFDNFWSLPVRAWSSQERNTKNAAYFLARLVSVRDELSELPEKEPSPEPVEIARAKSRGLKLQIPKPTDGEDVLEQLSFPGRQFYELRPRLEKEAPPTTLLEKLEEWLEAPFGLDESAEGLPGQDFFIEVRNKLEEQVALHEIELEPLLDDELSSTSKTNRQIRKEITEDFTNRVSDIKLEVGDTNTSRSSNLKAPSSQSSSGGGSTSAGTDTQKFGKLAELVVVRRGFNQFRQLDAGQRTAVVEAVKTWRNDFDAWNLPTTDQDNVSKLKEADPTDELFDHYRRLVDVSEQRHPSPGFDVIDPFGSCEDLDEYPRSEDTYVDEQMVRVEVKGVRGTLSDTVNAKLTGNEFKMARTPADSDDGQPSAAKTMIGDGFYRYVVRVVAIGEDADLGRIKYIPVSIRDISQIHPPDEEKELLRRLRGGYFWVNDG